MKHISLIAVLLLCGIAITQPRNLPPQVSVQSDMPVEASLTCAEAYEALSEVREAQAALEFAERKLLQIISRECPQFEDDKSAAE